MRRTRLFLQKTSLNPDKGYVYISTLVYNPDKKRTEPKTLKPLGKLRTILEKPEGWAWAEAQLQAYEEEQMALENTQAMPAYYSTFSEAPYAKIMEMIGFKKRMTRIFHDAKAPKWVASTLCALALQRIINPQSKVKTFDALKHSAFDYSSIKAHYLYEALEYIAKRKNDVIRELNQGLEAIKDRSYHLVIYDVTTVYFESFEDDGVRQHGMSKDHKTQETQVVLGLLIDGEGIPLTYELFPGNTAEVHTLLPVIENFLSTHNLSKDKVVIVADAGLNQTCNIKRMEEKGFHYIVGFPPSSRLPRRYQNALLEPEGWERLGVDVQYKSLEVSLQRTLIQDNGDKEPYEIQARLIGAFSEERQRHDLNVLDQKIKKTQYCPNRNCT